MARDINIAMESSSEPHFTRPTRTINLVVDKSKNMSLGFNIRGGAEFNLAIYVSGVTPDSLAEQAGFTIGDQIMAVNGRSFENITHQEAVDFILSFSNLSVVVIATGKVPDEEQPFGKHVFITGSGEKIVEQYNNNNADYTVEHGSPIKGEILNPIPIYDGAVKRDSSSSACDESIVPVEQGTSVDESQDDESPAVFSADADIYDSSASIGGGSLDAEKRSSVGRPTVYLDRLDGAEDVHVSGDVASEGLPTDTEPSVSVEPTREPSSHSSVQPPSVEPSAEVRSPTVQPPSKSGMQLNLAHRLSDDIPSDEEALIVQTPSEGPPSIATLALSVPPPPTAAAGIAGHRLSVGSNTSKKSGSSVDSQGSGGSRQGKKKHSTGKFGSLKFGSRKKSKSKKKLSAVEVEVTVTPTATPQPPRSNPDAKVLSEIDTNVIVTKTAPAATVVPPVQQQQQEQQPPLQPVVNASPKISHNSTASYSTHVMQKNAVNNTASEVVVITNNNNIRVDKKASGGSLGSKAGMKVSGGGGGSLGSNTGRNVARKVSSRGGSLGRTHSVMMSDTVRSRGSMEQQRDSMIVQRDKLVSDVYASLQDAFNEDDMGVLKQAIALYHRAECVEDLLNRILPLFTPLKFKLLRCVRKVVYSDEVIMFDGLVTSYLARKQRECVTGVRSDSVRSMWAENRPISRQPLVGVAASTFGTNSSVHSNSPLPPLPSAENKSTVQVANSTFSGSATGSLPKYESLEKSKTITTTQPIAAPKTQYEASVVETHPVTEVDNKNIPSSPVEAAVVTIVPEHVVSEGEDNDEEIRASSPEYNVEVITNTKTSNTVVKNNTKTVVKNIPVDVSVQSSSPKKQKKLTRESRVGGGVPPNKPYITVEKKISGEGAGHVSVYTGNGDGGSETLVFQDATYDNSVNAVSFNASLKLEDPSRKQKTEALQLENNVTTTTTQGIDTVDCANSSVSADVNVEETSFYSTDKEVKTVPNVEVEVVTTPQTVMVDDSNNSSPQLPPKLPPKSPKLPPKAPLEAISNPTYSTSADVRPPPTPEQHRDKKIYNKKTTETTTTTTTIEMREPAETTYHNPNNRNSIDDTNVAPLNEITHRTCYIDKTIRLIGMTISGGSDSEFQSAIHVIKIVANSAAYAAGIREGHVLISINETSLLGVTHGEACRLIKTAFKDKTTDVMTVCIVEDPDDV